MKPETEAACAAAMFALGKAIGLLDRDTQDALSANDPLILARHYVELREQAELAREAVAVLSKIEQNLSYKEIPLAFDLAGVPEVRLTGYGLVSLTRKWSCSFLDGKQEEGFAYLRDQGQGGMIKETVPAQTLGKWAHEVSDETGIEPPADLFKTSIVRSVSLRRSK